MVNFQSRQADLSVDLFPFVKVIQGFVILLLLQKKRCVLRCLSLLLKHSPPTTMTCFWAGQIPIELTFAKVFPIELTFAKVFPIELTFRFPIELTFHA